MVGPNEGYEIGVRDGKVTGPILGAVEKLQVDIYDGIELGSFLCSTGVTTYLYLGGSSLRDSHGSIDIPEAG